MAINDSDNTLPLADVLRAANELVSAGIIEDWSLGGALAAIYYVEPFTTYDADIFFIPKDKGLSAGIPAIYARLQAQGWQVEGEHLLVRGFPVQFLAASGLTEEAVREAERTAYDGVPSKIFRAEHIIAIAASVGRKPASNNCSNKRNSTKRIWQTCCNGINYNYRTYETGNAPIARPRTV